jgi:uncharacterized repeat protein (TIGR01451 family)
MTGRTSLRPRTWAAFVLAALGTVLVPAGSALAAPPTSPAPGWALTGRSYPTVFAPGSQGTIEIDVLNIGQEASSGTVTVTDTLPAGVTATEAGAFNHVEAEAAGEPIVQGFWDCKGNGPGNSVAGASIVSCTNDPVGLPTIAGGAGPPNLIRSPNRQPGVAIRVEATGTAGTEANHVTVAGGGAVGPFSVEDPVVVGSGPPTFELVDSDVLFSNADGTIDSQAGSHPYEMIVNLDLSNLLELPTGEGVPEIYPVGEPRTIEVELPPGLVGNPAAIPQCTRGQFLGAECPPTSQIGVLTVKFPLFDEALQVFNLVPPPGQPAEFAVGLPGGLTTFGDSTLRTGSDDGILTTLNNIPERLVIGSVLNLWGTPQDRSHDIWRAAIPGGCTPEEVQRQEGGCISLGKNRDLTPFLTLPTACLGPQNFAVRIASWEGATTAGQSLTHNAAGLPTGFNGCDKLGFSPTMGASPEAGTADTPTGFTASVKPSLGALELEEGLSDSAIRATEVALPPGLVINPGQAAGLKACQETAAESAIGTQAAPSCPAASKVGTVKIKSPLLAASAETELEGNVYVLQSNPPQLHLLVAASADGVNLKLVGIVHLDPATGRLTATFGKQPAIEAEDPFLSGHLALPQLPASEFKLTFDGGPKAALISPARCGEYQSAADFTPWASPSIPDVTSNPAFRVTAGVGGASCPAAGPLPFTPSMVAGTTNPVAGASSSFVVKVSKPDDQQNITAIDATLPPGQLAKLAGVPLCPELAAPSGNCPASSQVGSVAAAVGPGANPLQVPQPGKAETAAYLAGPYKGAPYSLVTRVPAQAGPFDLGTVVTRVALQVNETTTQVTAKSDPLPQILDGVPLSYQSITVSIDRPGFIRNPTNCEPMKVTGHVAGSEGANANVSNRYQIGDCASLAFKPSLKLSLTGSIKRSGNPALKAVLTYPQGNNANISKVATVLPASEFIDNAHINSPCTRVQFNSGKIPGEGCPAKAILGRATAYSPLLDRPLTGPVYFRSNGGERELPDLVVALRGQIPVQLVGFIDSVGKKGSETSRVRTTFASVPDAPVSRFVLELKGGKKGLLENAPRGNANTICATENVAQVKATGQNGKTYDTTPTVATSCGKAKKAKRSGGGKHS